MYCYQKLYIYIYILWRVSCLPLILSISPSLNRRPSPGSRREWVCERGGALKTARSGGVWWGTPEVNGASSPPLLYAECASPLETGLFPVHARWCPRGPGRERRAWGPHPWDGWRARMPGRTPGSAAAQRRTKPLMEAAALAPRTQEGSACGHRTPPLPGPFLQKPLPLLHNPRSTTRTPDPLFLLDTSSPLDTCFINSVQLKASPRPDATPTVSVVAPPATICIYIYIYIYIQCCEQVFAPSCFLFLFFFAYFAHLKDQIIKF